MKNKRVRTKINDRLLTLEETKKMICYTIAFENE